MPRLQLWPQDAQGWRNAILSVLSCSIVSSYILAFLCGMYTIQGLSGRDYYLGDFWFAAMSFAFTINIFTIPALFVVSLIFYILYKDKMAKWCIRLSTIMFIFALFLLILPAFARAREKPVIYLYPTTEQKVNVKLYYNGRIQCAYPEYSDEGWSVMAQPNGDLIDLRTGKHHYCLFWEGVDKFKYDTDEGFVVKGKDTAEFLESKLSILGLNDREMNEFIIYWLPKMQENSYNLVSFVSEQFAEQAKLEITPAPETIIRVFMIHKPLNAEMTVKPQELKSVTRQGFTVVEWGGSEL